MEGGRVWRAGLNIDVNALIDKLSLTVAQLSQIASISMHGSYEWVEHVDPGQRVPRHLPADGGRLRRGESRLDDGGVEQPTAGGGVLHPRQAEVQSVADAELSPHHPHRVDQAGRPVAVRHPQPVAPQQGRAHEGPLGHHHVVLAEGGEAGCDSMLRRPAVTEVFNIEALYCKPADFRCQCLDRAS